MYRRLIGCNGSGVYYLYLYLLLCHIVLYYTHITLNKYLLSRTYVYVMRVCISMDILCVG